MKKVSILLLLTTVLVSFSFAQVTVVGGFELDNVAGGGHPDSPGDDNKMDPALWTEFYGAASQELGPGSIGAELGLGTKLHLSEDVFPYDEAGDIYLKGYYALPAGPGELAIGLATWHTFRDLRFGLDYDGIAAGPAVIGLGVTYALKTTGLNDANPPKGAVFADGTGEQDTLTPRLSVDFDFGLGILYKFQYGLGGGPDKDESGILNIVYLDISYQVMDPLVVGLEVDDTGEDFKGFTVKPYVNYSLSDNTTAGFYIKLGNISQEAAPSGAPKVDSILITPGLTITHSF